MREGGAFCIIRVYSMKPNDRMKALAEALWLFPYFFDDHAFGIWVAMPVSDVLANLATIMPFFLQMRFLGRLASRRG